jgi:hypothetical protein
MIEERMRGSMLPPQRMSPTRRPGEARGVSQQRRESGRARAFRHGLLVGQERVHGALQMRLLDQQHLRHEVVHHRRGERADILHRDAFGKRRAADRALLAVQRVPHRRIERALRRR